MHFGNTWQVRYCWFPVSEAVLHKTKEVSSMLFPENSDVFTSRSMLVHGPDRQTQILSSLGLVSLPALLPERYLFGTSPADSVSNGKIPLPSMRLSEEKLSRRFAAFAFRYGIHTKPWECPCSLRCCMAYCIRFRCLLRSWLLMLPLTR